MYSELVMDHFSNPAMLESSLTQTALAQRAIPHAAI